MPGSNRPRPAVKSPRTGRPPDHARFAPTPPTTGDLLPEGTSFRVEGRADVHTWTREKRNDFRILTQLAAKFDLQVVETNLLDLGADARRKWDHKRVDLDYALATIKDLPGMLFDDWAKLWLVGMPETTPAVKAVRRKAAVALSRLYSDGAVEKRYDAEGRLILYAFGSAPPSANLRPGVPASAGSA